MTDDDLDQMFSKAQLEEAKRIIDEEHITQHTHFLMRRVLEADEVPAGVERTFDEHGRIKMYDGFHPYPVTQMILGQLK